MASSLSAAPSVWVRSSRSDPRRLRGGISLAIACATLLLAAGARGNSVGTVFSSAADGDGVATFWNPAAMSLLPRSLFQVVANVALVQASYTRSGFDAQTGQPFATVNLLAPRPEPVLSLVIDRLWSRRMRLGLSVLSPTAEGAGWPEKITVDGRTVLGPTRYHATRAQIFHLYTQLAASFLLHRTVSLGVTLNLVTSSLSSDKHLDVLNQDPLRDSLPCQDNPFGCENPSFSAPTTARGLGFSAGATLGILVRPVPRVRIGMSYSTPVPVTFQSTIRIDTALLEDYIRRYFPSFTPLGANGQAEVKLTLPQRIHAAIAVEVSRRLELAGGFQWVDASASQQYTAYLRQKGSVILPDLVITPSAHGDKFNYWLRAAVQLAAAWRLGLLVEYAPSAVPDSYVTPTNVDFHLFSVSLGARVQLPRGVGLGATFTQMSAISREITRSSFGGDRAAPFNLSDPSGRYTANIERVGLNLDYAF